MPDQPQHSGSAQTVVPAVGGELAAVGERLRFADHQRVRDDVAEPPPSGIEQRHRGANAVERWREIDHANDVAHQ